MKWRERFNRLDSRYMAVGLIVPMAVAFIVLSLTKGLDGFMIAWGLLIAAFLLWFLIAAVKESRRRQRRKRSREASCLRQATPAAVHTETKTKTGSMTTTTTTTIHKMRVWTRKKG